MRRWSKSVVLTGLVSAFLLLSCEPAGNPVAPSQGGGELHAGGLQSGSFEPLLAGLGFTTQKVSQLVGVAGGTVSMLGHSLTVPAGAVTEPTIFTITQLPGGLVEVDLRALVIGLSGIRDVGSHGFRDGRKVRFRMSYASAAGSVDPDRLVVLRVLEDGGVQSLPTTPDPATKSVIVELEHFSRYCMAMD